MGGGEVNANLVNNTRRKIKAKAQFCPTKEQKTWQHYAKEVTDIGRHEYVKPIKASQKLSLTKPMLSAGQSKLNAILLPTLKVRIISDPVYMMQILLCDCHPSIIWFRQN